MVSVLPSINNGNYLLYTRTFIADYIIDKLINQHGKVIVCIYLLISVTITACIKYQELLYLTEVYDKSDTSSKTQKTKQIKYYSPDNPNKWQPLSEIAGNEEVRMYE